MAGSLHKYMSIDIGNIDVFLCLCVSVCCLYQ